MTKINLPATFKQYNLDPNKMSTNIGKKEVENFAQKLSIKSLLQNLSLSATKNNQAIIIELLNHDLPLNKQLISELNDFISNLDTQDNLKTKIKIALLLKKINIPLNQKFYNFFKNYIFSKSDLQDNIKQLLDQLDYQPKNTSSKTNLSANQIKQKQINNLVPKTKNTVSKSNLNSILQKLELPINKKNRKIIKKLANYKLKINLDNFKILQSTQQQTNESLMKLAFAKKMNLNNSNLLQQINFSNNDTLIDSFLKLSKSLIKTSSLQPQMLSNIKQLLDQEPQLLLKAKNSLNNKEFKQLISKLNLSKQAETSILKEGLKKEVTETIVTANNINPESIKESLNKLNLTSDNQLVKFLFNLSTETSSEELKEKTENIVKQLINLKVVNFETDNTLLFLPIFFKKSLELAEIQVNKQKKSEESNESLKFSFKVETEKLDSIEVKLKIQNRSLNILFLTNNSKTKDLIQENLDLLEELFQQQNFKINYAGCKLQEKQENNNESLSLTTIDFTI